MNKKVVIQDEKLGLKELIAMGVGGMVGGGIFSVLGLSADLAGHGAFIAFGLGGIIALLTGWSYSKLGLSYKSEGGSFTYLEKAFSNQNIAALGGWLLIVGYIGTLSLYAYTFGVYAKAMLDDGTYSIALQHLFESGILLTFLGVNLYGVKAAGHTEDIIVIIKVIILSLFAVIGLFYIKSNHVLPIFSNGEMGVLMGAALIFVAYEGFELIPNAINETKNPNKNIPRAIMYSIIITIFIYILVSLVAVGNLTPHEIVKYKEDALAIAAKPFLGNAGFLLISLGALLSTSSAINATLFGTARLGKVMSEQKALPKLFSMRERTKNIPWVSLLLISIITIIFVNIGDLTIISSFSSSSFLLIFASINLSAFKLKKDIKISYLLPLTGLILCMISWFTLIYYLWEHNKNSLLMIGLFYLSIIILEFIFSKRRMLSIS